MIWGKCFCCGTSTTVKWLTTDVADIAGHAVLPTLIDFFIYFNLNYFCKMQKMYESAKGRFVFTNCFFT